MQITEAKIVVTCPGRNFVTLKIVTDEGLYGLGDATLNGRKLAVASHLKDHVVPCLIGRDPHQIEDIWQYFPTPTPLMTAASTPAIRQVTASTSTSRWRRNIPTTPPTCRWRAWKTARCGAGRGPGGALPPRRATFAPAIPAIGVLARFFVRKSVEAL